MHGIINIKYVEFHSKNKFEKLVHLVGFIIWNNNSKLMCLQYQELKLTYYYCCYCHYFPHLYIDSLRTEQSGVRNPLRARNFLCSAPDRTGPEAHIASCTTGTGSFPTVQGLGRDLNHPHPSNDKVRERGEPYPYSRTLPSWPVRVRPLPLP